MTKLTCRLPPLCQSTSVTGIAKSGYPNCSPSFTSTAVKTPMPAFGIVDGAMNSLHVSALLGFFLARDDDVISRSIAEQRSLRLALSTVIAVEFTIQVSSPKLIQLQRISTESFSLKQAINSVAGFAFNS